MYFLVFKALFVLFSFLHDHGVLKVQNGAYDNPFLMNLDEKLLNFKMPYK